VQEERTATAGKRPRRFARLPHDTQVERAAQAFCAQISLEDAIKLLTPEIERGTFLASGRYKDRCCATLTRDGEHPDQMCNAVSGWASSPAAALKDLAFRWSVLCQSSWMTANHIKLVSEISA